MNDRFKFRVWNKEQNRFHLDISCDITAHGTLILSQGIKGKEYITDDDNYVVQQCTGLKDKNGKLIYEGDIVKYAEFDWTDFSFKGWETETAQVVWGNTYDKYYPAFDLKDKDFDGTNAFAYLLNEGWMIEVIGNIYENKELLNEK